MEWRDEGIILGTRRHGETSAIVEVMTPAHGRHLGLVRGGCSRRMQPLLQPGNRVELVWRARLDEHLGTFQVEPLELNAGRLLGAAIGVYGMQTVAAHLRLLAERDPHAGLYQALQIIIAHLDDAAVAADLVVRFELRLLEELGFGLALAQCAATGRRDELVYVSPKTGRAVSREAGKPYHDKLLALPDFLHKESREAADLDALAQAYRLTGFFFHRHVYEPRGTAEPEARAGFLSAVRRRLAAENGTPADARNGEDAA